MRSEVSVRLADGQEFRFDPAGAPAMPPEAARAWLDQQFVQLDCEPLRATGKVLLVDKLVAIAGAAGIERLGDAQWSAAFARAASAALARPVVRVDLAAMTVSY
ncbi:hypothetical protein [Pseudorhodoferax sp.]|uniref:hypothetical protein n=1 Tax=Pseudorhodoferax sp. TaxID=1993553 RepID=UPI0039E4972A